MDVARRVEVCRVAASHGAMVRSASDGPLGARVHSAGRRDATERTAQSSWWVAERRVSTFIAASASISGTNRCVWKRPTVATAGIRF